MSKNQLENFKIKRGDVLIVDFSDGVGSEQSGKRPAVVIQNDIGNKFSPTTIVALLSTKTNKKMPTHVFVQGDGLHRDSVVLCEQIRTISKQRIEGVIGVLTDEEIKKVSKTLRLSLSI